ncbi:MAG: hypothetical protein D6681_21810 [Calditrichaeota bacterium]|nr:MAG: hypothetical protein D6681_21810 [Calditrichota bacterium]
MKRPLTSREKWLIGLAGAVVLGYVLIYWVGMPLWQGWQEREEELVRLQAQYLQALKTVRAVGAVGENPVPTAASGEQGAVASIAEFLKDIEAAAGSSVRIHRFQPVQSGNHQAAGKRLTRLQVHIECSGKLPDLMDFFERIEAGNSLTRIRQFYLTPEGEGDQLQCRVMVLRLIAS